MNKNETLKIINKKIDQLIIAGETKLTSPELKRLMALHFKIISE